MRLPLALALVAAATLTWAAELVEVEVQGVRLDPETGAPVVRLVEKGAGARELPIWIGPFEAEAIALELRGVAAPRPMTHDLLKQVIEALGGRLDRVVIEDLRRDTYFAQLHLVTPEGKELTVDARPSDAIALALRLHGPIVVADSVFAKSLERRPGPAPVRLWGLTLQDLTPDIAAFFEVQGARGVLVADVAAAAPTHDVARGDVITAMDGEPVATTADLAKRADSRDADAPVQLSLRRGKQDVTVRFAARGAAPAPSD
jgi:hypothetical protein